MKLLTSDQLLGPLSPFARTLHVQMTPEEGMLTVDTYSEGTTLEPEGGVKVLLWTRALVSWRLISILYDFTGGPEVITTSSQSNNGRSVRRISGSLCERYSAPIDTPVGGGSAVRNVRTTDRFALVAIDTGVLRRVDPLQLEWLKRALESARGKFIMAVLGHPLYAVGECVVADKPDFAQSHRLLREAGAAVVIGGDTHDLEYCTEPVAGAQGPWVQHHVVNGGGGA